MCLFCSMTRRQAFRVLTAAAVGGAAQRLAAPAIRSRLAGAAGFAALAAADASSGGAAEPVILGEGAYRYRVVEGHRCWHPPQNASAGRATRSGHSLTARAFRQSHSWPLNKAERTKLSASRRDGPSIVGTGFRKNISNRKEVMRDRGFQETPTADKDRPSLACVPSWADPPDDTVWPPLERAATFEERFSAAWER